MIDTVFTFFSTFNPMTFALLLSAGAIVVMRKPVNNSAGQVTVPKPNLPRSVVRRDK